MNPALLGLQCIRCNSPAAEDPPGTGCARCASQGIVANLMTVYDVKAARRSLDPVRLNDPGHTMWRYHDLLPIPIGDAVSLDEGGTPLVAAPRLARELGVHTLWLKDESRNPTWSFKDRGASVTASVALDAGAGGLVVSSTGNAAAATGAYGRRAGLPVLVLVARGVDPTMEAFVEAYDPMLVATPTKPDRWVLMAHAVEDWGWFPNSNYLDPPVGNNPYATDGYKTIGLEIWEQLGHRTPHWIAVSTGYGDGLFGMYKAFGELGEAGLGEMPRFLAGECSGSLAHTLALGDDTVHKAESTEGTVATSISNLQSSYQAVAALRRSDGAAVTSENEEIVGAQKLVVATEGLYMEASSAAAVAAVRRAVKDGTVSSGSEVVIVNTSSGMKSATAAPVRRRETPETATPESLDFHLRAFRQR